ncbi:MAG: DUF4054 domain-containing protein [Oscillospiraceae bacterium]|jgi:hypothetical protein|nr:DUF4054 domain-containing protein [Oscillospiraceae bacterium]
MATPLEIFRLVAAEFAAVSDETVNVWLELTAPIVSRKRFGRVYNQALALLTAHRMKTAELVSAGQAGGEGALSELEAYKAAGVASYTSGGESVSFGSAALSGVVSPDADYAQTAYGTQYVALRNLYVIPIINSGEGVC